MTERSRAALYQGLTDFIDEEAVGEMLSYFPARDVEEPATTELVRTEGALLRADFQQQMGELRADVGRDLAAHRLEVDRKFDAFAAEIRAEIRSSMRWTIGVMVSFSGVVVAAIAAFA